MCWLGGQHCDPDARDAVGAEGAALDEQQTRYLSNFVARYLPDLDSTAPAVVERCTFTVRIAFEYIDKYKYLQLILV